MKITEEMTSNNTTSGRVSHSGPMMKNRNHIRLTHVKDNAAPRVDTVGSNKIIMDQQRENLRIFNRADTMDNSKRQIKIPNDPSWYDPEDNKCTCPVHCWLSQVKLIRCWKNMTGSSSRNSPGRRQNNPETESCV